MTVNCRRKAIRLHSSATQRGRTVTDRAVFHTIQGGILVFYYFLKFILDRTE
jgi:hypothetical protein